MKRAWVMGVGALAFSAACAGSSGSGSVDGPDASAPECVTDADCKGARVCDHGTCIDAQPPDAGCHPSCGGRACGSDGCGGSCGTCPSGKTCSSAGACVTPPDSVPPGGKCSTDVDCDGSKCTAKALCVNEGAGAVCACTCSWGTDCTSGCCAATSDGKSFVCAPASDCKAIGAACSTQHECLNGACGSEKSYCYDDGSGASCGCGCASDADCSSGCCAAYSSGGVTFKACSAKGACASACSTCVTDADCPSGTSCGKRYCDGARACYAPGGSCPVVGGESCPAVGAYDRCTSSSQCGPSASCSSYTSGTGSYCRRSCVLDEDCPPSPSGYSSLVPRCDASNAICYLECSGPGTCPYGSSCLPYASGGYGYCG